MDTADREPTNITFFQVEPSHTTSLAQALTATMTRIKNPSRTKHTLSHMGPRSLLTHSRTYSVTQNIHT